MLIRSVINEADFGYAEAEGARDIGEQRLDVINIRDDHARARRHEPDGRARYGGCFGNGGRGISHWRSRVNDI
jgi:hypothetical protein